MQNVGCPTDESPQVRLKKNLPSMSLIATESNLGAWLNTISSAMLLCTLLSFNYTSSLSLAQSGTLYTCSGVQIEPSANERALEATAFRFWDTIVRRQAWSLRLCSLSSNCRYEVEVPSAMKVSFRAFTSGFSEEVMLHLNSKGGVGVSQMKRGLKNI